MTAFARADSRMPTTSRLMITSTITTARMLLTPTGGAVDNAVGKVTPRPARSCCM
jgi:hypothetical protein